MGHWLREDPHPDHRVGVGAPAHDLVLVLLRPARADLYLPRRPLVLHQEYQRRAGVW